MRPKHYFDETIEKLYFRISEVSEILHESPTCVRYWSDKVMNYNFRNKKNERLFTKKAVAQLHIIQNLIRVQRFTVQGAKLKLPTIPI